MTSERTRLMIQAYASDPEDAAVRATGARREQVRRGARRRANALIAGGLMLVGFAAALGIAAAVIK